MVVPGAGQRTAAIHQHDEQRFLAADGKRPAFVLDGLRRRDRRRGGACRGADGHPASSAENGDGKRDRSLQVAVTRLSLITWHFETPPARWGILAQSLHWLVVALVITQFVLARIAHGLPLGMEKLAVLARHKSVGITILGARDPAPALALDEPDARAAGHAEALRARARASARTSGFTC